MPVLLDTSAWIEFFKPKGIERVKRAVVTALEEGVVVTASPILVELLVGLHPGRTANARAIERLQALETVEISWDACVRVGVLGRALTRRGRRVPTVDLLIASAAASGEHEVWHAGDRHFPALQEVGGPSQRDLTTQHA